MSATTETHQTARNLLALARPSFMFLVVSFALMGVARSGDAANNRIGFLVVAAIAGWSLFAATLNDIGDTDVDRANLGHTGTRPLAYGQLERPVVAAALAASLAVTAVCAILLSWRSMVAVGCGIALVAAYSLKPFKLSSRGALTSMLLPAGYVVVPFLTGRFATGSAFANADVVLVTGLYVSFIGRLMLKDFRDEHGDALYGKRTFLVRFGRRRTCLSAAALWVAGAAVILAGQGSWTLVLLWAPFGLAAVWFIIAISRDQWGGNDVYHVAIAAVAGRATVVMLLADLAVRPLGTPWLWWAVQLPVIALTAPVIHRFAQLAAENPAKVVGILPSTPPNTPPAVAATWAVTPPQ